MNAQLTELKELARANMRARNLAALEQAQRWRQESFEQLVAAIREDLGGYEGLLDSIDWKALNDSFEDRAVETLTLTFEGHWPIECRYERHASSWVVRRDRKADDAPDQAGLWRVVKRNGEEILDIRDASTLVAALVFAEYTDEDRAMLAQYQTAPF